MGGIVGETKYKTGEIMKEKNFKFREQFGKVVENMTDKQAGEFIKALSGYVFNGKPMESKDEYLKGVFLYAQSIIDVDVQNRENGKLGGAIIAEKKRKKESVAVQCVSESNFVSQVILMANEAMDKDKKSTQNHGGGGAKYSGVSKPFAK